MPRLSHLHQQNYKADFGIRASVTIQWCWMGSSPVADLDLNGVRRRFVNILLTV